MGRESSYNECDDSNVGERGFRSQSPNDSEMAISCDPGPEPGLRKSESRGRDLERENVPFAFL
jgi:hypothetical protein